MRAETNWVGEWFPILEAKGEFVQIAFGSLLPGAANPAWNYLPHRDFDGAGGLAHLTGITLPVATKRYVPSFWRRLLGFFHYLRVSKMKEVVWKTYRPSLRGKRSEIAWATFTLEETRGLEAEAKSSGVSLNTFLLQKIDRVLSREWTRPGTARRWLIPVDMRGSVHRDPPHSNHASYVSVSLTDGLDADAVARLVRHEIRRESQWGAWAVLNSGRWIGRSGMRRMMDSLRARELCWMGTFSNLGKWTAGASRKAGDPQWMFCPPTLVTQPISLGALVWNDRLSLTLQLHPALSENSSDAWRSLEACATEIRKARDS
jgi:hypothetical protein